MSKCALCGTEKNDMQVIDLGNKEYTVCSFCDQAISTATDFENNSNTNIARRYIRERIGNCTDSTLYNWLSGIINTTPDSNDDDTSSSDSTFWISNLKAINRVAFFIILIIGIVLFFILMDDNFFAAIAALAGSIVCAMLVVGLSMVFLDMASDIHKIRALLEKNDHK